MNNLFQPKNQNDKDLLNLKTKNNLDQIVGDVVLFASEDKVYAIREKDDTFPIYSTPDESSIYDIELHEGKFYVSSDVGVVDIKNAEIVAMGDPVYSLCSHKGKLLGGSTQIIFDVLKGGVDQFMHNTTHSLCSHDGYLYVGYHVEESDLNKVVRLPGDTLRESTHPSCLHSYNGKIYRANQRMITGLETDDFIRKNPEDIFGFLTHNGELYHYGASGIIDGTLGAENLLYYGGKISSAISVPARILGGLV